MCWWRKSERETKPPDIISKSKYTFNTIYNFGSQFKVDSVDWRGDERLKGTWPLKCESLSWDSDIFWPVQWHFSVNTSDDILLNLKTQCQIKQSLCCMWPFDEKKKICTSIFVCATLRTWPLKNVCTSKVSESFRNHSSRIMLSKVTRTV